MNCFPRHYGDVTTPFDDPQAELAWMFLQTLCNGADVDEGLALVSDDFTYWSIITRTSFDKEALRAAIEQRKHLVPDVNIELIRCVNEGETVVIEGQADVTTATGARHDSPFVCIFDTRDGVIVSMREYSDTRMAAAVFPRFS
jgi:ketosteroid isomerase-like protein